MIMINLFIIKIHFFKFTKKKFNFNKNNLKYKTIK